MGQKKVFEIKKATADFRTFRIMFEVISFDETDKVTDVREFSERWMRILEKFKDFAKENLEKSGRYFFLFFEHICLCTCE